MPPGVDLEPVEDDAIDEDLDAMVPEVEPDARTRYADEAARGLRHRPDIRATGRQKVPPSAGTSPWVGKSREELSSWANERAASMSATAIGRSVSGRVNTP